MQVLVPGAHKSTFQRTVPVARNKSHQQQQKPCFILLQLFSLSLICKHFSLDATLGCCCCHTNVSCRMTSPAPSAGQDQCPCWNTTWIQSWLQTELQKTAPVHQWQGPRGCCSWHTFSFIHYSITIMNNLDWQRRPRQKSTPVCEWGGPRGCRSWYTIHLLNITNNLGWQR